MIEVPIPGRQAFRLSYLALDLNGTITLEGKLIDGVGDRLRALSKLLDIYVITADTFGRAQEVTENLGVKIHRVEPGAEQIQKLRFVQQLGDGNVAAVGNGSNDVAMLRESILGICVIGPEGTAREAVNSSDLVASDINTALDLLLNPTRLTATLRE